MAFIFLAYANSQTEPLPTLSKEDEEVYRILTSRYQKNHFKLHRESNATLLLLTEQLVTFREELSLFVFSGHAGRDRLLLKDSAANSSGIAQLLEACPQLKLVVLNGCSTVAQVEELLQLENAPVVIATSSPVSDTAATQFAITFFQCFCEQYASVQDAFQLALAAAQTATFDPIYMQQTRDFASTKNSVDDPIWGIFVPTGQEIKLEWSLPLFVSTSNRENLVPNSILLDQLMEGLSPFHKGIQQLYDQEMEGLDISVLKKRRLILEVLPHPISEHLRKLLVEREETSEQTFFDQLGVDRLKQLIVTYQSVIELPAFILLAQLWDVLVEQKEAFQKSEQQKELLKQYLNFRTGERIQSIYFQLIPILIEIFQQNQLPLFVEEFEVVHDEFSPDSELFNSCMFFEHLNKKKAFSKEEAEQYCIEGEEKLATILGKFGFLTRYTLVSVKNVRVKKNRFQFEPKYQHRLVELIQRFVGLEPTQFISDSIVDDSSIHLQKRSGEQTTFLNLSPFVIDENAFDDTAQVAKIYYFDSYQKGVDACCFRHIYKPKDNLLLLKHDMKPKRDKNWQLKIYRQQFDVFSKLLFDQTLHQL